MDRDPLKLLYFTMSFKTGKINFVREALPRDLNISQRDKSINEFNALNFPKIQVNFQKL